MRLIDFFVFYEATLYKSKEEENRTGNQRLNKATRVAGLIVATWITILVQLFSFIILKRNLINSHIWMIVTFTIALMTILILQNIYITNDRYQYVISEQYRAFKLGRNAGIFIVFSVFLISIAISVSIGIYLGNF